MGPAHATMSSPTVRTIQFPAPDGERGAFLSLLTESLTRAGVQPVRAPALTEEWVRGAADQVDIVHLHWLEFIAPSAPGAVVGRAKTARRAVRLGRLLRQLRTQGVGVVWTIHNLAPHEPVHPRIEQRLARHVASVVDAVIVHSQHACNHAAAHFGHSDKFTVIPHGNYVGAYPEPAAPPAELRRAWGIPDHAYVFLSFGQVRRYKRLPELAEAFQVLPGSELRLLIAGAPVDATEADRLRAVAAADDRIILDLRRIPTADVTAVHAAADAAVFSYDDMFSSGSALLALSCGVPIVAPSDSTGTEIADAGAVVAIESGDLIGALNAIRRGDPAAQRAAATATAERHDWGDVARATAEVYRSVYRSARQSSR
jgi:glycosyltransferase involved in cell wall biosynthesis